MHAALTLTLVCCCADVSEDRLLQQAEAAFARGAAHAGFASQARPAFAEAARAYETLRQRGADNVELHRNHGTVALLADELAPAIAAWRRGLCQDPEDDDLQQRLRYARSLVTPEQPGARAPFWLPPRLNRWLAGLALLAYCAACVLGARWWLTRRAELLPTALLAALLAGAVAGGWLWRQREQACAYCTPRAILVEECPLYLGNDGSYPRHPDRSTLPRGTEATVRFRRGDWMQLELPGGFVGWVPRARVLLEE